MASLCSSEGVKSGISDTTGERQTDIKKLKQMMTAIIRRMERPAARTVAATGMNVKNSAQIGRQIRM